MIHRTPDELPNEHVLMYPQELSGKFKPATDHEFNCIKPSSELPKTKSDQIKIVG